MRVLTVSTIFPSSVMPGQGVFVKQRAAHLPDDIEVEVWRPRPWFPLIGLGRRHQAGGFPAQEVIDGLSVRDLRFFYTPGVFKQHDSRFLAKRLLRELKRLDRLPDLIDAHFAYPTGHAAVLAGRELGIPVTITLRGTITSYRGDARVEKMREALLGARRVMSVSASLADVAREIAGPDLAVDVIPNGIDTAVFGPGDRTEARRKLGIDADAQVLLTVGGLVPRKGAHRVIAAMPELLAGHPSALYLFVGGGGVEGDYGTEVRKLIADKGCEEQVKLVGEVAHDSLVDYYRAADLFVLATSNEGWANVIQEALACGTPVVATDVGGNREVVGDARHGILVPLDDGPALQSALRQGLESRWDHEAIATWGRRRGWPEVGESVAAVFREAVGE